MWTCPTCERNFKSANQWHSCTQKDIGELFLDKPDELVLAFDTLVQQTASWGPMSIGAAKYSIVFASPKAWLIVKPMRRELDVKFYAEEVIPSERIRKTTAYGNKYAHHIRLRSEEEVDDEVLDLLKSGYRFSLD